MFKNVATVALAVSLLSVPGVNALANTTEKPVEVRSESVNFDIRTVEDKNLPKGVEIVVQEGKQGERTFFKEFKELPSSTGAMTSVPVFYDELTELPVEKVIRKGTKTLVIDGTSEKTLQLEADKKEKLEKEKKEKERKERERKQAEILAQETSRSSFGMAKNTESPRYVGGGNKEIWLKESGIPEDQWKYVDYIVSKESGWNPNATNPSSAACGLAQALPCSKISGKGGYDPVTALKWQYNYVNERYGGYAQAYEFWSVNRWY